MKSGIDYFKPGVAEALAIIRVLRSCPSSPALVTITLSLRFLTNLPSVSPEQVKVLASLRDKRSLCGPPFLRAIWTGSLVLLFPSKSGVASLLRLSHQWYQRQIRK